MLTCPDSIITHEVRYRRERSDVQLDPNPGFGPFVGAVSAGVPGFVVSQQAAWTAEIE